MLPHSRSIEESPQAVAEERRLLYVGMTRARERLYLSYAFRRNWYGSSEPSNPSRFLADLPDEVLAGRRKRAEPQRQRWSVSGWGTKSSSDRATRRSSSRQRPQVERQFHEGQRVHHRRFGEGIVRESEVESGDEIVTVLFLDNQVKRFLAGVAPLEPVSEH